MENLYSSNMKVKKSHSSTLKIKKPVLNTYFMSVLLSNFRHEVIYHEISKKNHESSLISKNLKNA
jgi:hypothetical protein